YIYKRKSGGIYVINLKRTWEKFLLAAGAIVAIENPTDVSVISSRNTGQRAVLNGPEEIEKEEQAVAEKAVTRRDFRVNVQLQLLSSLILNLKSQTVLKVCGCPLCLLSSSLLKTGAQPTTEDWSAAPTAQATEWVGKTEWS
ncbi:40s ribosomal protein sa, partial [Lynx pardinus]